MKHARNDPGTTLPQRQTTPSPTSGARRDIEIPLDGIRLIVGGNDPDVLKLNQKAYSQLACDHRLQVVPGATHLFEEPATLEQVANHAIVWFQTYGRFGV